MKGIKKVVMGDDVETIGDSAFSGCSGLVSVSFSTNVTSIGNSAFRNCSLLNSISLPEGITTIGSSAFTDCDSLKSLIIPRSVISIGTNAFNGTSIYYVVSEIEEPFKINANDNIFPYDSKEAGILKVPVGTRNKYKENGWSSQFSHIVELEYDGLFYNT